MQHLDTLEGVTLDEMLYNFAMLARTGTPLLRSALARYNAGNLPIGLLIEAADRVLPAYFCNLRHYCICRESAPRPRGAVQNSLYGTQSYRWNAVRRIIDRCAADFESDKPRFLRSAAQYSQRTGRWLLDRNWRFERSWPELAETAIREGIAALILPFSWSAASRLRHKYKDSIDAEALVDRVLAVAQKFRSSGQPFFIWTHLFDTHIPFTCGAGRNWLADSRNWLSMAGHDPDTDLSVAWSGRPRTGEQWSSWCALYDACIRFVDHHIGRLRHTLDEMGLGNTLIVVTSDHGEELGEHGDNSHRFRLYEHNVHVNTFYYHPDFGELEIGGLSTLMDLAPTIADVLSVAAPDGWEGKSLFRLRAEPRDQIEMETTFGSPSDAKTGPVYLGIRQGRFKLLYIERVHPRDLFSREGVQLFDVVADPGEQVDISGGHADIVANLMPTIKMRLEELRRD